MKTNSSKLTNLKKMDNSLDKILHQATIVYGARRSNANAYDDCLAETWATFRMEAEELQKEISKIVSCIQLEDGET